MANFETTGLQALFEDNDIAIHACVHRAFRRGYGSLVPCTFVAASSKVKMKCRAYNTT